MGRDEWYITGGDRAREGAVDDDDYCDDGNEEIRYHGNAGLRIGKAKRAINPSCIAFSDRELGK